MRIRGTGSQSVYIKKYIFHIILKYLSHYKRHSIIKSLCALCAHFISLPISILLIYLCDSDSVPCVRLSVYQLNILKVADGFWWNFAHRTDFGQAGLDLSIFFTSFNITRGHLVTIFFTIYEKQTPIYLSGIDRCQVDVGILTNSSVLEFIRHKAVHKCTWYQNSLGQRSVIDFVVVSSALQPYVLDTWVKRGAELSADNYLVVSWIRWWSR